MLLESIEQYKLQKLQFTKRFLLSASLAVIALTLTPLLVVGQGVKGIFISAATLVLAGVGLVALTKPRWLVAGFFLILGLFAEQLFIPGVPLGLRGSDILMGLIIAVWVMEKVVRNHSTAIRTRLDLPISLFLVAVMLATFTGIISRWYWRSIYFEFFKLIPFALFFPFRDLFARDKDAYLRLVFTPICVGTAIGAPYALFSAVSGETRVLDFFQPDMGTFVVEGIMGTRAIVAGNNFILVVIISIPLLVTATRRYAPILLAMLMLIASAALVVDFSRSRWAAVLIGLSVLGVVILARRKLSELPALSAIPLLLAALAILTPITTRTTLSELMLERISVTRPADFLEIPGEQHRIIETHSLIQRFLERPLTGQGLGLELTFYSPVFRGVVQRTNWHNDYAMLLAKLGLLGALPFAWAGLQILSEGLYVLWHSSNRQEQLLTVALIAYLAGVAVASLTIAMFTAKSSGPVIVATYAYLAVRAQQLRKNEAISS